MNVEPVNEHPIRMVVTDDLRRSRLTVGFRLLLAIPHLLWLSLFGSVVFVVAVINWFALLLKGRSPDGLHAFVAGYLRYATHVEAYVSLAANPFPAFFVGSRLEPYPVDVEVGPPAPQRRLMTLFRLFLAIPAILISVEFTGAVASGGGFRAGAVGTAALLIWFAALVVARAPRGLRDLTVWGLGYSAQTFAYLFLLTDRYPQPGPAEHLAATATAANEPAPSEPPARLTVHDDLRRSRLTVFFRLPLAAPHLVWFSVWLVLVVVAVIVNWFATLVLGRSPRPLARFIAAFVRYVTHFFAFLHLVGNPFPGFTGKSGRYPVDVELEPFGRQRRVVTAFRLLLAIPALLVNSAVGGLLFLVAVFGWFVSLARGRMPQGLRDAGAYALGYGAQLSAYLFLLSDRYPYSGPVAPAPRQAEAA